MSVGINLGIPPLRSGGSVLLSTPRAAHWDFSRMDMLRQDIAGSIPVTASGQPIGRVLDLSGNGRNLVAEAANSRPTFYVPGQNLRPCAQMVVDDYLVWSGSAVEASAGWYLICVGFNAQANDDWRSLCAVGGGSPFVEHYLTQSGGNTTHFWNVASGISGRQSSLSVFTGVSTPGLRQLRINGSPRAGSAQAFSSVNLSRVSLGARIDSTWAGNPILQGWIGEMALFRAAEVNPAKIAEIEQELLWKWSIG